MNLYRIIASLSILLCFSAKSQTPITFSPAISGTTISTCFGFIIDSGGQGGTGYSNGETSTITVCPDTPGEIISVTFNLFSLSTTDDNPSPNASNLDYMFVYDGNSTAANTLGTYSGNQLQGVVIQSTALNASGCLTFTFTSNSIGTGMFSASVACETPCNDPIAGAQIINGITTDSIRVCLNEVVDFSNMNSFAQMGFSLVEYSWDFMDGSTSIGQNVSHSYSIPGLYRVQLFVTDDNDCTNNNLTDLVVMVAPIPDFSGFPADTTICIGQNVTFTSNPESYEVLWDGFPGSQTINDGCLPDTLLGVSQNVDLLQTGFTAGTSITNISQIESVCFELEHSFMGDIVVILECPNGQNVILHQQGGGGTQIGIPVQADNVDCSDPATMGVPFTYCFTPTATTTWVEWVTANGGVGTIPAGDYEPIQPLTNLIGCPANGVWTLSVIDNWAADDGTLFSFALNLSPSFYPPVTVFEPQIGLAADSSYWNQPAPYMTALSTNADVITIAPTIAGTYNYIYTVVDDFGCVNDTSVNITVNPNPIVFAGNDTTLCGGNTIQLNGTLNGAGAVSDCSYDLLINDTFGDGWNGNTLTVLVNGVSTSYTLAFGTAIVYPITIPSGSNATLTFNANGSWIGECQFSLVDENGTTVLSQGPNLFAPTTNTIVANCAGDFVYSWTPIAGLTDAAILDPLFSLTNPTVLTLSVYPIGAPECTVSDAIAISLSSNPDAGIDGSIDLCSQSGPVDLFLNISGTPATNGIWLDLNGNPILMPYDPAVSPPGDYTYQVELLGCFDEAIVTVNELLTEITSIAVTNVNCNSFTNGSILVNGVNIATYSLDGAPQVATSVPFTLSNFAPGTYSLEVFSLDGCSDIQSFTVTQPQPLQITSITQDTIVCSGALVNLSAVGTGGNGVYIYSWTLNGNSIGQGQTLAVNPNLLTNNYCVTLSEACGSPTDNDCMVVTTPPAIVPAILPDIFEGCFPVSINFENTTNSPDIATTTLNFGDGISQTNPGNMVFSHVYQQPGLYTVTANITSIYGCQSQTIYTNWIQAHDYPEANFAISPNNVSMFNAQVELLNQSSSDAVAYNWQITNGNPLQSNDINVDVTYPDGEPAFYPVTLTVENEFGCEDSITLIVNVLADILIYAPNTFTPDNDEFNQNWGIHISGINIYDFSLYIFNRWGEIVWESHDAEATWDGTYNGEVVSDGAYNWTINCGAIANDNKYTFQGNINIIR